MKKRTYSIYIDKDFPIAMSDTAYFLENVDNMFVAMFEGNIEGYFGYFPKMKLIMDLLHKWGEEPYESPGENKEED